VKKLVAFALIASSGCVGFITGGGDDGGGGPGDTIVDTPDGKVGGRDLRRLTVREYDNTIRDVFALGDTWKGAGLPPDQSSPIGFDNDRSLLVVDGSRAQDFETAAELVADTVIARGLAQVSGCAQPGRECAAGLVETYGAKLLRHAITDDDRGHYLGAFDKMIALGASPEDGVKWTLVAMLDSPYFLYRSELGAPSGKDDGLYKLTGEELATALAYDFSASPPSDELLAKGRNGELATPEARVAEARALLDTPRGHEVVNDFLARWLNYREVKSLSKDASVTAGFEQVRDDMAEETERFLDHVFFEKKAGVAELFTSNETYLTPALAAHYGLPAPAQPFGLVTRPPEQALGLLAQGSILSRFALTNSTSPPQRGAFIRRRFLCQALPPPPPNVGLPPVPQPGTTTRERYTVITSGAACTGCHQLTNEIGFALEHFDAAGRYRADEGGLPIDPSGTIVGFGKAGDVKFADGVELAQDLAHSPDVAACVGGRMASYAFGMEEGNVLAAPAQTSALVDGKTSLYDFYAQLAGAAHFGTRAGP
jgi:hypothetical protein